MELQGNINTTKKKADNHQIISQNHVLHQTIRYTTTINDLKSMVVDNVALNVPYSKNKYKLYTP